jgi:hypothetical protein
MKNLLLRATLMAVTLAVVCPSLAVAAPAGTQPVQPPQEAAFKNAQDYVEFFRRGGKFYDQQLPGLMIGNQPDPEALNVLGRELATGQRIVRKKIIDLLDDVRRLSNPEHELRTPEIIDLLVGPGFAKADSARNDAMNLLRVHASAATLSRHGDVFLRALKEEPGESILLLIAKAKSTVAWEEVDRLSQLPEWNKPNSNGRAIRIARAALGDTKIEDEYIAAVKEKEAANDAQGLAAALAPLAQIGTQRSLHAVCLRMRSPLTYTIPGVREQPMPLIAMEKLVYAFPEEFGSLSSSDAIKNEDYIRAEEFCTKTVGVKYKGIPRSGLITRTP